MEEGFYKRGKSYDQFKKKGSVTGSCAMIDWNCGGERTFEAWRNSSSVRMVERERLICAGSGILFFFISLLLSI